MFPSLSFNPEPPSSDAQTRLDAVLRELHHVPVPVAAATDIAIVFEWAPAAPLIIAIEWRGLALDPIGGERLLAAVREAEIEPGAILVVVVLDGGDVALCQIRLRRMQPGGVA